MTTKLFLKKFTVTLITTSLAFWFSPDICRILSISTARGCMFIDLKSSLIPQAKAEVLRPTAFTDNAGQTGSPTLAYDSNSATFAETTTSVDALPSITYHSWQTTSSSYSSLVLYVNRSSTGHVDDTWGIEYSIDGGTNWEELDPISSANLGESPVTVSISLDDPTQDLSLLQVRINTDKKRGPDSGRVCIYDIRTEGIVSAPIPVNLEQSAYRFFINVDSVDVSAIVSNADGVDEARAIAKDSGFMYIAGFEPGRWRIEKRSLDDGSLEYAVTNDDSGQPNAIAVDGTYMYVVGDEWRIEKRLLSDGTLVTDFGTNGVIISNPSDERDSANAIAIDGTYMYVIGSDFSPGVLDAQWRVEKRWLSDGDLVSEAVNNPSALNDVPKAIAIDDVDELMYVVGYDRITGASARPKKRPKDSSNAEWRIEKRSLSDLSLIDEQATNPTDNFDLARGIAIDSQYMYVVGSQELGYFDTAWRIEKRWLSDLSFETDFGEDLDGDGIQDGIIVRDFGYDDQPEAIAIDTNYMYIVGYSADAGSGGDTAWRIEKRDLLYGALDYAIVNDIYSDYNDRARSIVIDANYMYIAGYDNPGLAEWRMEIRDLANGSLSLLQPLSDAPSLSHGQQFRLRLLIHVQSGTLTKNLQQFKLQFSDWPGETFQDVTSTSAIAFWDNPTPTDGDFLLENLEDPTHESHNTLNQTYEEENSFSNPVSAIEAGEDGMWDFSLYVNVASAGDYAFRVVRDDDTPLEGYVYPVIAVAP